MSGTWLGLRHGWYELGAGWKFETLIESEPMPDFTTTPTAVPLETAALADPSGGQNVFVSSREPGCSICSPYSLSYGRYPGANGKWAFSEAPPAYATSFAQTDGRGASVTTYGNHTEVFGYRFTLWGRCEWIYHAFSDGVNWQTEAREARCPALYPEPRYQSPTAAASYPPFNQLHASYAHSPPAIGHFWYNPA
ncbi:MAG: hypothetical protein DCC49_09350 [Acidobacteria bacterium]|nr:MAG: hypothetical protein DCC49_09350 [Acidobacteriota bacterium]